MNFVGVRRPVGRSNFHLGAKGANWRKGREEARKARHLAHSSVKGTVFGFLLHTISCIDQGTVIDDLNVLTRCQ